MTDRTAPTNASATIPHHDTTRRLVIAITRMSIHNGPGIRTLVQFKGCPLRCVWCSTPESQQLDAEIAFERKSCTLCGRCIPVCHSQAITLDKGAISMARERCDDCGKCAEVCYPEAIRVIGQSMTIEELVDEATRDAVLYKHSGGGVTISGGEPLLKPDFTAELLKVFKVKGISTGVDTCGYVPWPSIAAAIPHTDFFLWDIKHMDPERHREFTGAPNELILSNARTTAARGVPIYVRFPVIPGFNDSETNIRATCEFASGLASLVEVHLEPVHHFGRARYQSLDRPYPIEGLPLIPDSRMQNMKQLVESYGLNCRIGG